MYSRSRTVLWLLFGLLNVFRDYQNIYWRLWANIWQHHKKFFFFLVKNVVLQHKMLLFFLASNQKSDQRRRQNRLWALQASANRCGKVFEQTTWHQQLCRPLLLSRHANFCEGLDILIWQGFMRLNKQFLTLISDKGKWGTLHNQPKSVISITNCSMTLVWPPERVQEVSEDLLNSVGKH